MAILIPILCLCVFPLQAKAELSLNDLFPTDRVLDVQITVSEENWDDIRKQSRDFRSALSPSRKKAPPESPYTWVEASVMIDGVSFPAVGLRKKGFIGSQSMTRPSLKIKLDYRDKGAAIGGLSLLTLNNNKQDSSLMNQFMGYQLFNRAGSPAPRCAYAKVTVNGKNLGVYSHVESFKEPLLERAFGNSDGTLYEGTVVDFYPGWEGSFEKKSGKRKPGREKIDTVTQILNAETDLTKFDYETLFQHVNPDAFYRFWAIEGLLGFWDGYTGNRNNYFFYLNPVDNRFRFLPWGADGVFGHRGKLKNPEGTPISVNTKGMIAHRLYQVPSVRERYRSELLGLLEHEWSEETLLKETERIESMLRPHVSDEQRRKWRPENIRRFIRGRRAELMDEVSEGMPIWTTGGQNGGAKKGAGLKGGGLASLRRAILSGDAKSLKWHLLNGADINERMGNGGTVLATAVLAGHREIVEMLLAKGADPNVENFKKESPIHTASVFGRLDCLRLLLDADADVNVLNGSGQTALDIVQAPWSEEMEEVIKIVGSVMKVDVTVPDVIHGREKAVELLQSRGAKTASELR